MAPDVLAVCTQYPVYWYALYMSHPRRRGSPLGCPCRSCRCSSPSIETLSSATCTIYPTLLYYNLSTIPNILAAYSVASILVRSVCISTTRKELSIELSVSIMPAFIAVYQHAFVLHARAVPTYVLVQYTLMCIYYIVQYTLMWDVQYTGGIPSTQYTGKICVCLARQGGAVH